MFHADFVTYSVYAHGVEAMVSVKCPPFVIVGERDQITLAKVGHHVTAGSADSRIAGLPGGHMIMGECPGGTLDALIAFVRERNAVTAQGASWKCIMATTGSHSFGSFAEFYSYYLGEHQDRVCRRLHFAGLAVALVCLILLVLIGNLWWLLGVAVSGYAFVWVRHFGFEKDRPATFRYPFYSLMGDRVMCRDIWAGKTSF